MQKIETEEVSTALCERLRRPLLQLLSLLQCGRVLATDNDEGDLETQPTVCTDCAGEIPAVSAPQLPVLLGVEVGLASAIAEAISACLADPLSVARLVHTPEWTR